MVKIAFYTITGQTQRFIDKTGLDAHRIEDAHPQYQMNDKYILILPSYQDFMMDSVVDFLTYKNVNYTKKRKDNKKNLLGLIGCGNRNFNDLFGQTAKKISVTLHVPILYLLELSGNSTDVKNVRQIVMEARKKEKGAQKDLPIQNPALSNISFLSDFRQKNE